ncbi:MAG: ferrochelatase [Rhodothermia bacterium]|nr:ferrochelatase [Rhodothermia bacterium]
MQSGAFFPSGPVDVTQEDRIGVVLLNLGGPASRSDVESFLYRRWMDPVLERLRIRRGRHVLVKLAAKIGARLLWKDYEQIGGECPINRLTREQASALQEELNGGASSAHGIRFKTYIAMRYGSPDSNDALRKMRSDGITRSILLPLYPQYSMATTGSSLAYWFAMTSRDAQPISTTAVVEYAAHPGYIQALSDRIDQALQRVPRRLRSSTHVVFSAEHPSIGGHFRGEDSFCAHVRETIQRVMSSREQTPSHLTYFDVPQSETYSGHPETRQVLKELGAEGVRSVVVVPIGLATDHLWTAYTLDIALRQELRESGIEFYEVTSALNCHRQFISALADIVTDHIRIGTGSAAHPRHRPGGTAGRHSADARMRNEEDARCHVCSPSIRAREWKAGSGSAGQVL